MITVSVQNPAYKSAFLIKTKNDMDYQILVHSNRNRLEEIVKSYLDDGWELQGGVSVAIMNNTDDGYAQAVIKH